MPSTAFYSSLLNGQAGKRIFTAGSKSRVLLGRTSAAGSVYVTSKPFNGLGAGSTPPVPYLEHQRQVGMELILDEGDELYAAAPTAAFNPDISYVATPLDEVVISNRRHPIMTRTFSLTNNAQMVVDRSDHTRRLTLFSPGITGVWIGYDSNLSALSGVDGRRVLSVQGPTNNGTYYSIWANPDDAVYVAGNTIGALFSIAIAPLHRFELMEAIEMD